MDTPAYQRLADDLRAAITRGDYQPGQTLPRLVDLAAQYGITRQTASEAFRVLEREGLVQAVRRRGTVVLDRTVPKPVLRSREVRRDEIGYYFDQTAQPWRPTGLGSVTYAVPPRDISVLLGTPAGEPQLRRSRIMGDPETRETKQLADSWLPADLTRGTMLEQVDTGQGGIYDRLEEMGHGPLQWQEIVTARMPSQAEVEWLEAPPGVPLMRVLRLTTSPAGRLLEINDTVWRADLFAIGYELTRHETA